MYLSEAFDAPAGSLQIDERLSVGLRPRDASKDSKVGMEGW